ncbi:hypothetical protein Tco_0830315 [Tanacetum coccineum]
MVTNTLQRKESIKAWDQQVIQDYALWEVIENGNSWVPIPVTTPSETGTSTATKMTMPSTAEEKTCKKNDSMFAAIKARFGGNEATKKTQKPLLKQQYENFNASSSESLDSIFNRLQRLVSRLVILGVVTLPEDLNVKFLRSLPSEWDTHVVVWMNKPDFDTMGLDDLYNNFKIVEQKVKKYVGTSNDDKNLAFLTTSGASSTNNINTVNPAAPVIHLDGIHKGYERISSKSSRNGLEMAVAIDLFFPPNENKQVPKEGTGRKTQFDAKENLLFDFKTKSGGMPLNSQNRAFLLKRMVERRKRIEGVMDGIWE